MPHCQNDSKNVDCPRVSIVMSVYNTDRFLPQALDSILQQTYPDFELIIVDDGSTDASRQIIDRYARQDLRIRTLYSSRNMGLTRSLNKGIKVAEGEFIARQDADDISHPDRLEKQVAYLDAHPKVGLLGTNYFLIDGRGQRTGRSQLPCSDTGIRWNMLFNNVYCHSATMFRRHLLSHEKKPYDLRYLYGQDVDLWCRLMRHGQGGNLPLPLVSLRKHDGNISARHYARQQHYATHIAFRQIRALMPGSSPSLKCIHRLRQLHRRLPAPLTRRDLYICALFFDILNAFAKQPGVNAQELLQAKVEWIAKILRATPHKRYPWFLIHIGPKLGLSTKEGVVLIHFLGKWIRKRLVI
jgi:glycosyltransferase involved in cell wall biosynthesis